MGRGTSDKTPGTLIIIGGKEDREKEMQILRAVVECMPRGGKLCVLTVASMVGHELWAEYRRSFKKLGVKNITHINVVNRRKEVDARAMAALKEASAVFFSGGDQLRITSEIGGTSVLDRINEIYADGGVIAGTSAGASVMSETMLVMDPKDPTFRIGSKLHMGPGLGLVKDMIIDQHFGERGRISRLVAAVAQNPRYLGIGIDENTAIVMKNREFRVLGRGAVFVIDAHEATESSVRASNESTWSIFGMKFHVMSEGDVFEIRTRTPHLRDSKS